MLFFPLSLCLSLPVSSAKRRKMADKILPQRVRLHIFTFVVLFLLCVCVCVCVFLSFVRRAEQSSSAFDVGGFLEGAEGQTIVYYFQMRRERIRVVIRRFSRFFRVSLCFLVGGILIWIQVVSGIWQRHTSRTERGRRNMRCYRWVWSGWSQFPSPLPVRTSTKRALEVWRLRASRLKSYPLTLPRRGDSGRHGWGATVQQWVRHGECLPHSSVSSAPWAGERQREVDREGMGGNNEGSLSERNMKEEKSRREGKGVNCNSVWAQFGKQQPLMLSRLSSVW